MLTSAMPAVPLRTAATPTMAQSCARRLNFWNDQPAPGIFGTRISMSISSGASAVSRKPSKKSVAAISASTVRALRDERAPEREHYCREVGCRIAVGDRAAQRAAVAHLRVADLMPAACASSGTCA